MKLKTLFLTLSIASLSSCTDNKKKAEIKETSKTENIKPKVKAKSENTILETKHCFIKSLIVQNGKNYAIADYVDFLTQDKAIEKAIENDDADYDINEKGDTIYFVYNDYYVSNINPKLRTLELADNVKIELWNYPKNNGIFNTVNINELEKHLSSEPIMILKIENGIIIEMREQYVP